ncbi:MAG: hypothetical protein OEV15_01740 [Gallionella sp.]|nr:hypothetical protein [Gallionella sp.]
MSKPHAEQVARAKYLPAWKKLPFALFLVGSFFAGLELILAAAGVRPPLVASDPFVGFAQHIPLFVEESGADGRVMMVTAKHKRSFFNLQQFPKQKIRYVPHFLHGRIYHLRQSLYRPDVLLRLAKGLSACRRPVAQMGGRQCRGARITPEQPPHSRLQLA